MKKLVFLISIALASQAIAQNITQNIRGQVIDKFTKAPLPGASILIKGSNPPVGAASDFSGKFVLKDIPVGRVVLEVTFIGYESLEIPNVNLTSGKEVVLVIEMDESIESLQEITLTAEESNLRTENEMVTLSGRTFSIEETQRFAGARNDVARMATKMPGVRGTNDAVNDIVIRGNAPSGLLWRLEGLDIPNPNHFGKTGASGGPVSMLNNNVLRNSDFLTAAFPAQYGNALSGVFDLKMRTGNSDKHEFLGQIGFNGFEFGAEGPVSRSSGSSYLVNYRYSVLGIMKAMGMDFGTGAAVPEYQDLTFKLHFPMKNGQNLSFFGLGGISKVDFVVDPENIDDENFYGEGKTNTHSRTTTGVIGANYYKSFGSKTLLNIQASAGTLIDGDYLDTLDNNFNPHSYFGMDYRNATVALNAHLSTKLNSKNNVRFGFYGTLIHLDMMDSVYRYDFDRFVTLTDIRGQSFMVNPYVEWQYRPAQRWKINAGLHSRYFHENSSFTLEPRVGVNYNVNEKNDLKVAYGLHSQTPAVYLFFREVTLSDGTQYRPNTDLGPTSSHHFVVGWDHQLKPSLRFRAEAYFQSIYNAVIDQNTSAFSLLNVGSFDFFIPDSLENGGPGTNYGIDLSLEQFMNNGMYYLTSVSLYQSKYSGSDGVERNTAWAGDFVVNLVGGKEFNLNKNKENARTRTSLTVDLSLTYAGGQRYTPIDVEESEKRGITVPDFDQAYTLQYPNYFRTDLRVGFKIQGKKVSQEWALDIQNLTNQQNIQFSRYNPNTGEIDFIYQIGILPIMQYRIHF